ncbi:GNAT family N-acetyltransferase [Vibrio viridaestus]|uniref:N-acetyltransferase n=1 Tax=Vibrio viridaestus TaxID=2487322 RepID=A0A3N9U891_9VIBR|nr:GNAT family N-acetyltransferase [Vibrio viridaestus]RQW64416.1 N-acetyltransferase [Vibrio viridaestus]
MINFELETPRLRIRQWREEDKFSLAKMNSDPNVMQFFPSIMTEQQSDALYQRMFRLIERGELGFYAVELKASNRLIGMVGLLEHGEESDLPFAPGVEIGWRLAQEFWGNGYATEAALATLQYAFQTLEFDTVYSLTAIQNAPSRRVMEKIGMRDCHNNFAHPSLPLSHALSVHCLYIVKKDEFIYF